MNYPVDRCSTSGDLDFRGCEYEISRSRLEQRARPVAVMYGPGSGQESARPRLLESLKTRFAEAADLMRKRMKG